jgi:hypothetical protein
MSKKYSHIICIGDSITNEYQHYKDVGIDKIFQDMGYHFKGYPEILSELYGCEYVMIGEPGKTMTFTIQDLIKNVKYITSLENPLVLYQFGYFMNSTIKLSNSMDFMWKDLIDTHKDKIKNIDNTDDYITLNKHSKFIDSISEMDKISILNWFEKFEEYRNYYFIEYFLSINELIQQIKPTDVFGFFWTPTMFSLPKHENLLWLFEKGYGIDGMGGNPLNGINHYLRHLGINDGHKSTEGNRVLAEEIKKRVDEKTKK